LSVSWLLQTFGGIFESDGRLTGDKDIRTISCSDGSCRVNVPAPSFALVFVSEQALGESDSGASRTFPTTLHTKTINTLTVDPRVIATSNGHSGFSKHGTWSTSRGIDHNAAFTLSQTIPSVVSLLIVAVGGIVISGAFTR
jgi:hypothetical protein